MDKPSQTFHFDYCVFIIRPQGQHQMNRMELKDMPSYRGSGASQMCHTTINWTKTKQPTQGDPLNHPSQELRNIYDACHHSHLVGMPYQLAMSFVSFLQAYNVLLIHLIECDMHGRRKLDSQMHKWQKNIHAFYSGHSSFVWQCARHSTFHLWDQSNIGQNMAWQSGVCLTFPMNIYPKTKGRVRSIILQDVAPSIMDPIGDILQYGRLLGERQKQFHILMR